MMEAGFVYILINPSLQDMVKIGRTIRSSESRAAELSKGTGVPTAFAVVYEEYVTDCETVEQRVHQRLHHRRVNPDREFFHILVKDAIRALQEVAAEFTTKTNENPARLTSEPRRRYTPEELREVDCLYSLGEDCQNSKRWDEAIKAYQAVLAINPKHAESHFAISQIYRELGNLPKAAEELRQAAWCDRWNELYLSDLIEVHLEMGDHLSALKAYRILRKVDPLAADMFLDVMPWE